MPKSKTNPFGTKTGAQDGHGNIYSFRIRFAAGSAPRKDEKRRSICILKPKNNAFCDMCIYWK